MAPAKKDTQQKSRRSRKARTAVSSSSESSSSDSESSVSTPEPQQAPVKRAKQSSPTEPVADRAASSDSDTPPLPAKTFVKDAEQDFQDFYLKQATKEFSEDLDKLRNAGDWRGQGSLEVLIGALKQGGACFGEEERRRVGGSGVGKG